SSKLKPLTVEDKACNHALSKKNHFPFNSIFLVGRTLVLPIFLSKKCSWEGDRLIWEGSPVFV
ncbi:TPA: hypothetical protein ACIKNC_000653, partial [Streptococcus pneumoniae]